MSRLPISDYALLSDCHSAALVSRGGSVDWLCLPRFDSPAIFGRLLDEEAGHWVIRPAREARVTRRYAPGTLVLETRFETDGGTVVLTDAMAVGPNNRGHDLGEDAPHAVLRVVRCERGEVEVETEYAPRAEYGLVYPLLMEQNGGLYGRGGAAVLLLSTSVPMQVDRSTARGRFTLREREIASFALQYRASMQATIEAIAERLTDDRGLILRYDGADGLPGEEGPFLLCTFWLAEALALAGDHQRARETFENAARFVNDVGLLSEEVDPASDELIGNFPQAFSHVGLINAAWGHRSRGSG